MAQDSVTAIYSKGLNFTKNRFSHSLKIKTDSVTESAFNLVTVIPGKDLALLKPESVTAILQKRPESLLKTKLRRRLCHCHL